ncbi:glycosyl hydrolase family 28-related protein [Roseomonas marmotae]|uniref:glycosyl hydrolase family 28-related protein n=1 Tax=Roseomonas marmotae TaxID=2768161 RepID=UPI001A963875|nr:glycosyl hydrolase family 28-related protein [Roseomonas marmotae]
MQSLKISELPSAATLADADIAPLVQGSAALAETRRTTFGAMRRAMLTDRALHVRDYGAVGNGTTDDTAAIQAAINAAAAQGGGVVLLGPRRYLVAAADLTVKEGVFLRGRSSSGGWRLNGDFSTVNHAILLDSARTIRIQRNGGLDGLAVLRRGLTAPTTLREGLDAAATFDGTAITVGNGSGGNSAGNGADVTLCGLLILGFHWGIYSHGNARLRVRDVLGDARNGLFLGNAFDVCRISEVNWHPLVTTSRIWSNTRIAIADVTDNGAGRFRVTLAGEHSLRTGDLLNIAEVRNSGMPGLYGRWTVTVVDATRIDLNGSTYAPGWNSGGAAYIQPNRRLGTAFAINNADMATFQNCFEYGHEIGFDVQTDVHACGFVNCGADGWVDAADPTTIGIRISGTAQRNKFIGGFLSSKGVSVQLSTTGTEQQEIIGVDVTGGARRIAEILSGQLSFVGCDFTGAAGTGNQNIAAIHMAEAAGNLIVTGCDTRPVTFTADSAAAMKRIIQAANRTGTGSTNRLAAGRVEIASVADNAAIETRLSADSDGAVNIHRRGGNGAQLRLFNSADRPAAAFTLSGTELNFAGDPGNNPNAALSLGGTGMTQPQTLRLRRLSASPVAADRLAVLEATGNNSAASEQVFARVAAVAETVTSGGEAGALVFETRAAGTVAERLRIASNGTATLAGPLVLPGNPTANLQAATKQYVDGQFTERRLATVVLSGATPLTHAAHNARMLIANPGAGLSLSWANTLDGFSCIVVNRTGADLALSLSGFTVNTAPSNADGFAKIRAGGVASLLVYSPDGGTTRVCHLSGAGAP